MLLPGACFEVRDGKSINIWLDPWVPWIEGFKPKPKDESIPCTPLVVENLINPKNESWNQTLMQQFFDQESVEAISKITIPLRLFEDKLMWVKNSKGEFSIKSSYFANLPSSANGLGGEFWKKKKIWKLKMHDRLKMLLWRIGSQ